METNVEKKTEQMTMNPTNGLMFKPLDDVTEMEVVIPEARLLRLKSKKGSMYYAYELVMPDGVVKRVQPDFSESQAFMYMMMLFGKSLPQK